MKGPAKENFLLDEDALLSLGSMEGIHSAPPRAARRSFLPLLPGLAVTGGVALFAFGLHYLPVAPFQVPSGHGTRRPVSAAIIAIVAGMLLRNLVPLPHSVAPGCRRLVRFLVPTIIVLAGAGLDLAQIAAIGWKALTITWICMGAASLSAYYCGLWLGLWKRSALLIGAGTAICGTSAIVAVAPLIEANDEDVALSVSTVNLLGLCLMFSLPLIGGYLGLSSEAFGIWAGSTIHAVPQAVAAGFAFSEQAGTIATLVKLVRVAMLAPFLLGVVWIYRRRLERQPGLQRPVNAMMPRFLWGFLALAAMATAGLLPDLHFRFPAWLAGAPYTLPLKQVLAESGNVLLIIAMGAMGLEVGFSQIAGGGRRAIVTGIASTLVLCAVSWMLIRLLF
ncbi:MAG TPA: putative sulfate exporter family transporter [Bryobacteraceae bacterium]|nr:putative sulfate exporter family transporter [Bryobacteraceae bacterium]